MKLAPSFCTLALLTLGCTPAESQGRLTLEKKLPVTFAQLSNVVELRDGRILMLIRTIVGRMYRCYSADGGSTWTKPEPTDISCGGTLYVTRVKSGRLALVWNPANYADPQFADGYPHGFDKMLIALSDDDGMTWHKPVAFIRADRVVHSLVSDSGRPGELLLTLPSRAALLVVSEDRLLDASSTTAPLTPSASTSSRPARAQ